MNDCRKCTCELRGDEGTKSLKSLSEWCWVDSKCKGKFYVSVDKRKLNSEEVAKAPNRSPNQKTTLKPGLGTFLKEALWEEVRKYYDRGHRSGTEKYRKNFHSFVKG